ncbi:MAG: InlB B-repeat-containing protein [Paludibacteraceae bacterium]|nr:InlB B-repeat-containing protein [Paludibacteraceae bacterium]
MKKLVFITISLLGFAGMCSAQQTDEKKVNCGEKVQLIATPNEGYVFTGWDDGNTDNPRFIDVDATMTVLTYTAQFTQKESDQYTINVAVAANMEHMGTIGQASFVGKKDDVITLTATPTNKCYVFDQWQDAEGNTLSMDASYDYTIEGDASVYALFKQVDFTVSVSADEQQGTVTISKVEQ